MTNQKAANINMLDRVERLLATLDQEEPPIDKELANWLTNGFLRKLNDGVSMDAALNISGVRMDFLRKRRNHCLVEAWLTLDSSLSPWQRSGRLATIGRRFENGRWRHLQFDPKPPDSLDATQAWLFRALKTGLQIPGQKMINEIVKNSGRYVFHDTEIS